MFWFVMGMIWSFGIIIVGVAQLAILVCFDLRFYSKQAMVLIAMSVAFIPTSYIASKLRRRCVWEVDSSGISSPAIGRIEFDQVESLYIGYPTKTDLTAGSIRFVLKAAYQTEAPDAYALIFRMSNGTLFPLDVSSPAISNNEEFISKVTELLVGKIRPNSEFSGADQKVLASRPANKFVTAAA